VIGLAEAARNMVDALAGVKEDLTSAYQSTLYDIGVSLVFYTPIKTGLASSNWNVADSRTAGQISAIQQPSEGPKGAVSLENLEFQVKDIQLGASATFTNPVDYIDRLEEGYSQQAPAGMVTPTKLRIDDIWLENLDSFKLLKQQ